MLKALPLNCLTLCLFAGALPVGAQQTWELSLGVIGSMAPQYIGSDSPEYFISPVGAAAIMLYEDTRFYIGAGDGLGIEKQHNQFSYGIAFDYRVGIKGDDLGFSGGDHGLDGMRDPGGVVTLNPYIKTWSGAWVFKLDLEKGLQSNNKGLVSGLTSTYNLPINSAINLLINAHAHWADDAYVDDYFGVDINEARTNRGLYRGKSGLLDYGLGADMFLAIAENKSLFFHLMVRRLAQAAADSDLVQERLQPQFAMGYLHSF